MGLVDVLLFEQEVLPWLSSAGNGDGAGALAAPVRDEGNAGAGAGGGDPVPARSCQVVGAAGQDG